MHGKPHHTMFLLTALFWNCSHDPSQVNWWSSHNQCEQSKPAYLWKGTCKIAEEYGIPTQYKTITNRYNGGQSTAEVHEAQQKLKSKKQVLVDFLRRPPVFDFTNCHKCTSTCEWIGNKMVLFISMLSDLMWSWLAIRWYFYCTISAISSVTCHSQKKKPLFKITRTQKKIYQPSQPANFQNSWNYIAFTSIFFTMFCWFHSNHTQSFVINIELDIWTPSLIYIHYPITFKTDITLIHPFISHWSYWNWLPELHPFNWSPRF